MSNLIRAGNITLNTDHIVYIAPSAAQEGFITIGLVNRPDITLDGKVAEAILDAIATRVPDALSIKRHSRSLEQTGALSRTPGESQPLQT